MADSGKGRRLAKVFLQVVLGSAPHPLYRLNRHPLYPLAGPRTPPRFLDHGLPHPFQYDSRYRRPQLKPQLYLEPDLPLESPRHL